MHLCRNKTQIIFYLFYFLNVNSTKKIICTSTIRNKTNKYKTILLHALGTISYINMNSISNVLKLLNKLKKFWTQNCIPQRDSIISMLILCL